MNKRITRRTRIRSKQQRKLRSMKPKIPVTASIFFFPVWVRKPVSRFHLILQTTSNDMDRFWARQRMVRRCAINFAAIESVVNDACVVELIRGAFTLGTWIIRGSKISLETAAERLRASIKNTNSSSTIIQPGWTRPLRNNCEIIQICGLCWGWNSSPVIPMRGPAVLILDKYLQWKCVLLHG